MVLYEPISDKTQSAPFSPEGSRERMIRELEVEEEKLRELKEEEKRLREELAEWERQQRQQKTYERAESRQRSRREKDPTDDAQSSSKSSQGESDFEQVLGLSGDFTFSQVQKQYRELVQQYHPDKVAHLGESLRKVAEQETKRLNEAYSFFKTKFNDQENGKDAKENRSRYLAFFAACANGDLEKVGDFLASGIDVNVNGNPGTPLHLASANGHFAVVELLLDNGAELDVRLRKWDHPAGELLEGATALILAQCNGWDAIADLLLTRGADANSRTRMGLTGPLLRQGREAFEDERH